MATRISKTIKKATPKPRVKKVPERKDYIVIDTNYSECVVTQCTLEEAIQEIQDVLNNNRSADDFLICIPVKRIKSANIVLEDIK